MLSHKISPTSVQASILFATIAVSVLSLWWLLRNKRKKNYVHVGKVTKLFFFPVKSIKGIEVSSIDCVEKGAQVDGCDDRSYMLISGDGFLCSQRQEPRMVLITPSISGNHLYLSGSGMETLKLDLKPSFPPSAKIIYCRIFTEEAPAIDCGDEASAWFQKFLNRPDVRLVYNAEGVEKRRCIRDEPFKKKLREKHITSFQDLTPFHLVTQASLDDLNSVLEESAVTVNNFRPNVLIEGCNPYEEDKWKYIKFSSGAEMVHLTPCGRCVLTTNNPETGVKSNKEPLVTLRKYRAPTNESHRANVGTSPLFGLDCGLLKRGKICIGDDVFAVVQHEPFKY